MRTEIPMSDKIKGYGKLMIAVCFVLVMLWYYGFDTAGYACIALFAILLLGCVARMVIEKNKSSPTSHISRADSSRRP